MIYSRAAFYTLLKQLKSVHRSSAPPLKKPETLQCRVKYIPSYRYSKTHYAPYRLDHKAVFGDITKLD